MKKIQDTKGKGEKNDKKDQGIIGEERQKNTDIQIIEWWQKQGREAHDESLG